MNRSGLALCAGLALATLVFAGPGCNARDDGSSPEAAVRSLIAAARAGDRTAVYDRFGPRTRAHIEALLAATHPTGGARLLTPEDLVTVGWLPPAWEASGTRLLNRGGDGAEVEVYGASGDRQAVHTVREGKVWKVELPLR
ncbi:MAG TPA: hypothetical protein VFG23_10245 [Polyangia bacterium]|nr:hypothetical protein [Polyangia bacterium]